MPVWIIGRSPWLPAHRQLCDSPRPLWRPRASWEGALPWEHPTGHRHSWMPSVSCSWFITRGLGWGLSILPYHLCFPCTGSMTRGKIDPDEGAESGFSTTSFLFFILAVLEKEASALCMLGRCCATEYMPSASSFETGSAEFLRPPLICSPPASAYQHAPWSLAVLHLVFSYWVKDTPGISIHSTTYQNFQSLAWEKQTSKLWAVSQELPNTVVQI